MRSISEKSLTNVALHYLRRYSATQAGLKRVLLRRCKRHAMRAGEPYEAAVVEALVDKVTARMVENGYVNDERLAQSKSASLHRQGKSARAIAFKLRARGVPQELVTKSIDKSPESELEAAMTLVARRKLGRLAERAKKDLAVLMRAGFSYGVAKRAMAQATVPT